MNPSNLASPFLSAARAAPRRVALSIGGNSTSYGELARFAGRIASWLLRSSVDGHVGVFAQRSATAYAGVLGACMAGRPWVPIGVDLPVERQLTLMQRGGVRLLIADRAVNPRFCEAGALAVLCPENLSELDALEPLERPRSVA
ncbi:MAG TPA: AMP-binding protein, partial [Polyangiaceae bacterium]|nr:AMP-binding protein [Polyangiaceae bacterium]